MIRLKSNQRGFTIIELMVATVAFSVIMLILTASVVQIGRLYQKGVISSQTQGSARSIIDAISRNIQFSQNKIEYSVNTTIQPNIGVACIGSQRFTFALNAQVDVSPGTYSTSHKYKHALWQDTSNTCTPVAMDQDTPSTGGKELLQANSRLSQLDVVSRPGNLWMVNVGIIYGDDDLVNFADAGKTQPTGCLSGVAGSQWCSTSILSTQVIRRVQ